MKIARKMEYGGQRIQNDNNLEDETATNGMCTTFQLKTFQPISDISQEEKKGNMMECTLKEKNC